MNLGGSQSLVQSDIGQQLHSSRAESYATVARSASSPSWSASLEGWGGSGGWFPSVVDVPAIISDKLQQSVVYVNVEVDFSVVLQRHVPTVQNCAEDR